jgi:hypothetical protein
VWQAWLDAKRVMWGPCIAYTADGWICRHPARIVDRQRGGLVYADHAPAATTEEGV